MNNFTTIEKYAIIKVLSHIMKADGVIHPKEEEYMDKTYRDFCITINDLEDISNIDDIQTKLVISGMSDENKNKAQALFVGMAKADGFLHPKETEIINQFFV
ncbi:TerB family tellurite resistance protein [Pseudoprevotella muciniphila]|uniref:TerB family tellurite resistance protein n=1 Tax=Pseudoprevotella muciniphila TaxID=2133944 RepID=A0A5P8E596_9BACT|nr:TerB family tellurite resistance protein [Pseudoprevotella muciniphila]QFQ12183.1 TerB family tellurite resistance protein [Pseudoprevotella muciniphila]